MATSPIQPSSLSFEAILADLIAFVQSLPTGYLWLDWLQSSAGTTVCQLIAGLGAFLAFKETMNAREFDLDTAQNDSSIYEGAFNRGFLVPPSQTLNLNIIFTPDEPTIVTVGQLVALGADFSIYSLQAVTIPAGNTTIPLLCTCGNLQQFTLNIRGFAPFTSYEVNIPDTFVATDLEVLQMDGNPVILDSDINFLSNYGNDFILRRTLPDEVRLYVGNGVLGWYVSTVTTLFYQCLTYSQGTFDNLTSYVPSSPGPSTPWLDANTTIFGNPVIVQSPVYSLPIETVRGTAIHYPQDGRVVTDLDYSAVILKYFGGVLEDTFAFNDYPVSSNEEVHMIASTPYPNVVWPILSANITSGHAGLNYHVNDVVTIAGGTGGTLVVDSIGAGGSVATGHIENTGSNYVISSGNATSYSGTGSGLQIDITTVGNITSVSIDPVGAGVGYNVGDVLSMAGGTGAQFTVDSVTGTGTGSVAILSSGSLYHAGDVVSIVKAPGTGGFFTVDTVDGGGAVLTGHVSAQGLGYSLGTATTTGSATGSGLKLSILTLSGIVTTGHLSHQGYGYSTTVLNATIDITPNALGSGCLIDIVAVGDTVLPEIIALINSKRGEGILVTYTKNVLGDGVPLNIDVTVNSTNYTPTINQQIQTYLETTYLFKYQRQTLTLFVSSICADLSAQFGIGIYPTDPSDTIDVVPLTFFNIVNLNLTVSP